MSIAAVLLGGLSWYCAALTMNPADGRFVAPGYSRFSSRVSYDGTSFRGFQIQSSGARTVQGELEKSLQTITQERCRIAAASRTDTGVHSRGQCVHFDVKTDTWGSNPQKLSHKLNQLLPDDVQVWNCTLAPTIGTRGDLPWHANIASTGKLYVYRWRISRHMDPLSRVDRALIYNGELDIDKMRECLPQFVGTHDFSSFANRLAHKQAANGGVALDSHRRIRRIELIEEDDRGLDFRLEFELDGALYKMIRNIAGMIHGVGAGEFCSADIPRILAQKNRNLNPARAAPAQGLTLEHVYYKEY